ncbi:hypothetical protein B0T19DRAFT_405236 [Cercophora scortea]|uniref:Uncharacterized protein n=1 Tax=Cercophora scortea TaxID=314031 RepID=A0AAE0I2T2_9PEZI|nr:hypothetical protein B0T19DRAFT_405236 [Cercophora scortea]
MFRSRAVPLLFMAGVGSGIYYQTAGGKSQPRSRQSEDHPLKMPVSETLQSMSGQGGRTARSKPSHNEYDPKNTKIFSHSPDAHSKRNPTKVRDIDILSSDG